MKDIIKDCIYYGSFLVFPLMMLLFIYKKKIFKCILVILWCGIIVFSYARFIEPQIIVVHETEISVGFSTKIALISDIHLGRYKGKIFLKRLVKKLNNLDVDYVFIAGDLTYEPNIGELDELFSALKSLKHETYWVLGNHDVQRPGPNLRTELIAALDFNNFHYLNNDIINIDNFTLVGLGSNWNNEDDTSIMSEYSSQDNIVVLMHNPDSLAKFPENIPDIALAGHTHGGQIRIPFLYKKMIPTQGLYDRGYTQEKESKLFITSGVGEVGLPMRLLNPPVIDVLILK